MTTVMLRRDVLSKDLGKKMHWWRRRRIKSTFFDKDMVKEKVGWLTLLGSVVLLCPWLAVQYVHATQPGTDDSWSLYQQAKATQDMGKAKNMLEGFLTSKDRKLRGQALYELGVLHLHGRVASEVPRNWTRALTLLEQSSSAGNVEAQNMLASLYATSTGPSSIRSSVKDDTAKSVLYSYFASLSGSTAAARSLGYRHLKGLGVPQSCPTAMRYYKFAADHTVSSMEPLQYRKQRRELLRLSRDFRAQDFNDEENRLEYFLTIAEKTGNAESLVKIGLMFQSRQYGKDVQYDRARKLFEKSAAKGEMTALSYLAHMYAYGLGVAKNLPTALNYYQQAAKEGHGEALNGLGLLYMNGEGVRVDHGIALDYFLKAADQGHPDGVFNVGFLLEKTDPRTALKHYEKSAHAGHVKAIFRLGRVYEHGRAAAPSCLMAVRFYKLVAEMDETSEKMLVEGLTHYQNGDYWACFFVYLPLAEQGNEVAQMNIAFLIENSYINVSETLMIKYYERASHQGNIEARVKLGDLYFYGSKSHAIDYTKAMQEYKLAGRSGHSRALFNAGYMHQFGIGVNKDANAAKSFYLQSMDYDKRAYYPVSILWVGLKAEEFAYSVVTFLQKSAWFFGLQEQELKPAGKPQGGLSDKNIHRESNEDSGPHTALSFDKEKYVVLHPATNLAGETFTIETWIKIYPGGDRTVSIVSRSGSIGFRLVRTNGGYYLNLQHYPDAKGVWSKISLHVGEWYHIAAVKHESYVAIYINGKMEGVRKYKGRIIDSSSNFHIGNNQGDRSFMKALVAEVRLWSTWMSPDEVKTLMKPGETLEHKSQHLETYLRFSSEHLLSFSTGDAKFREIIEQSRHKRKCQLHGQPIFALVTLPERTVEEADVTAGDTNKATKSHM